MADIVKIFAEITEEYKDELSLNEINKRNYNKVFCYGVLDNSVTTMEYEAIKDRLFLRILSKRGGNLYPILAIDKQFNQTSKAGIKGFNAIKNSLKNMVKYLSDSEEELYRKLKPHICIESIFQSAKPITKEKGNYLLALFDKSPVENGKTFNELFPSAAELFTNNPLKTTGVTKKATCFINGDDIIGYDPMLPFCSVDQMPKNILAQQTKFRLLPLGKQGALYVKLGYERIFNDRVCKPFNFKIFEQNYILLPSILKGNKRNIYNKIMNESTRHDGNIINQARLEERLLNLIDDKEIAQSVMLTFLFYEKVKERLTLFQTIEDVVPSRIKIASDLMAKYKLRVRNSINEVHANHDDVFLDDYINNKLTLAKLVFGKEVITSKNTLYSIINNKILHGNNKSTDKSKRSLSKIISAYFPDDVNFVKHQRFLDFLHSCSGLENKIINHIGADMKFLTLLEMLEWKFSNVDLLKTAKAKELYILGALAKLVMNWQFKNNSTSLSDYLDSIGSVNVKNRERVFTRIYKAARSYQVYGNDYDYLLEQYSAAKSVESNANITVDTANIAFVMGSIDYKSVKDNLKEIKNEEKSETV